MAAAAVVFLAALAASELRAESRSSLAENLFRQYSSGIYQVQAVSTQSDKKNAIGSGFQISSDGYLVTNYHVVSGAVFFPSLYHIRTIRNDGEEQSANIVHVDVVHDLAIVKVDHPQGVALTLGTSDLERGSKLFAIGNPMDFGMTIVEGLSNGYMDKALYRKVLTSLALNPGMSGGPTLDESGKVVGVNVSTAGNALSFVVPVEFLRKLWLEVQKGGLGKDPVSPLRVQEQLLGQEREYYHGLLAGRWERQTFGGFQVPTALSGEFTCWGEPQDRPENWLTDQYLDCRLKDDIFISPSISTHQVNVNYSWLRSRSRDPQRFYALAEKEMRHGYRFDMDETTESDVENFQCRTDLVKVANKPFWVSTCARPYKLLPLLYDINVRMASLGAPQSMLVAEVTLGGVTRETAKSFMDKFYREIRWGK
ncbi:MAG: trypsin-like peptidase domain-containing protein [Candidatus Omnitrophica bacterium]|nr:trypsin-like peptidase domain-containing protein [Candidatus Omnitrophota bacterium]